MITLSLFALISLVAGLFALSLVLLFALYLGQSLEDYLFGLTGWRYKLVLIAIAPALLFLAFAIGDVDMVWADIKEDWKAGRSL